jgi:diaminohydroxyphosphoribosylaminopyrimidine deaminase/5-amino-6-(5-phosphoribosylamino)uracil reductase
MPVPAEHFDHLPFMRRALDLAIETIALASPNPRVGCVLVRKGKIVGEGAHVYDQFDHAEIVALKQADARGIDPSGATAYVTLEPCSHHGRTGPCADALILAGITQVVVATEDPNPEVRGRGIAKLRAAGIEVTVGPLCAEARALNDAFAHFILTRRPFVTLKAALSVDGRLAPPPGRRYPNQPFWLTGPAARADVQRLRHASDAILTGIGTVLADDPSLADRSKLPRRRPILRVVLDTHLRIPIDSQLVRSIEDDLLILCATTAPTRRAENLRAAGAEVEHIPSHRDQLSLPAVLDLLAERNLTSLLLECGSALNGSFLQQDLVDQAVLFYTETELGPAGLPFATGQPSPYHLQQRLTHTTRETFPNGKPGKAVDVRIAGYLHNPWDRHPGIG